MCITMQFSTVQYSTGQYRLQVDIVIIWIFANEKHLRAMKERWVTYHINFLALICIFMLNIFSQ